MRRSWWLRDGGGGASSWGGGGGCCSRIRRFSRRRRGVMWWKGGEGKRDDDEEYPLRDEDLSPGGITSSCSSCPNPSPPISARTGNSTGRSTGRRRTNAERGYVQHSRSGSGTGRRNSGVGSGGPCGEDPAAAMVPSRGSRESRRGGEEPSPSQSPP